MKVVNFAAVMIFGSVLTAFAQSPSSVLPENGFLKFTIGTSGISNLSDSLNKGKLNVPFSAKNLYFHDPNAKELRMGEPTAGNHTITKGMTIFKPKGSFPMPVYKPDSTIRFFLQIKDCKNFPSNDIR